MDRERMRYLHSRFSGSRQWDRMRKLKCQQGINVCGGKQVWGAISPQMPMTMPQHDCPLEESCWTEMTGSCSLPWLGSTGQACGLRPNPGGISSRGLSAKHAPCKWAARLFWELCVGICSHKNFLDYFHLQQWNMQSLAWVLEVCSNRRSI